MKTVSKKPSKQPAQKQKRKSIPRPGNGGARVGAGRKTRVSGTLKAFFIAEIHVKIIDFISAKTKLSKNETVRLALDSLGQNFFRRFESTLSDSEKNVFFELAAHVASVKKFDKAAKSES